MAPTSQRRRPWVRLCPALSSVFESIVVPTVSCVGRLAGSPQSGSCERIAYCGARPDPALCPTVDFGIRLATYPHAWERPQKINKNNGVLVKPKVKTSSLRCRGSGVWRRFQCALKGMPIAADQSWTVIKKGFGRVHDDSESDVNRANELSQSGELMHRCCVNRPSRASGFYIWPVSLGADRCVARQCHS